MAVKMIVGLQYGDEGKGRAVHYEAKNASIVIRATGGSNAGHTVVANRKKICNALIAICYYQTRCTIYDWTWGSS